MGHEMHSTQRSDSCIAWAVIVTYHPDLSNLRRLLDALVSQVDGIVIVDNGSKLDALDWMGSYTSSKPFILIPLHENRGIAAAQNAGISCVREHQADYVILFDQDSEPAYGMIEKLKNRARLFQTEGVSLGAVAPVYKSAESSLLSGVVRLGWLGFKRAFCEAGRAALEADFLIASGSLIPMSTLDAVGDMDESLFIDHVDTEWCFRARSKGFRLFGVCEAVMTHSLGNCRSRIWFLRWRTVSHHSPFRYYYIFRNSVRLQKRAYMPLQWKVADFFRCLRSVVFFGFFADERLACLKMMGRGVRDGLKDIGGRLD